MNLIRIKQKIALLCILLLGILSCAGMGVLSLNETKANAQTTLNDTNSTLFLPESYEQYLPLKNPSSFAISSDYIVVADGCNLYIYDRLASEYSKYQHKGYPQGETEKNISKVQIAEIAGESNDRIFFSDIENRLYEYEKTAPDVTNMIVDNVPVTTFVIDGKGEYLYVANATTESNSTSLQCYRLKDQKLTAANAYGNGQTVEGLSPLLTIDSENLYVCYGNTYVVPFKLQTLEQCTSFFLDANAANIKDLQSICSFGGKMYYTVKDTGLFKVSDSSAIHLSLGGEDADRELSVLGVFGEELYCVKGSSIRKLGFDGENNAFFADYEISSASASVGRLSGATDVARAGSLVVVADTANHRVTVYDCETETYSVIKGGEDFSPTLVATDGETVAAVSGDKVYVCKYWEEQFTDTAVSNNGNIIGIACVYGSVYYVTQNDIQGRIDGESVTKSNGTPTAMTSDLYGNLYVAYQDSSVRSFTEEQFIAQGADGTVLEGVTVPQDAKALRADFEGNIYWLDKDGKLCGKSGEIATIDGKDFVYTDEESIHPVSFALGYEDDEVYFLFGNFIVKTNAGALGFPTLATIDASGVYEEISRVHTPEEVTYAEVQKGAVGIKVDLSTLTEDTACFPYASYSRTAEKDRGVVLAETAKYELIALYHDRGYDVRLFRKEQCALAEAEIAESAGRKYLSSACGLYNYPCIADASAASLSRGTAVRILYAVVSDTDKEHDPDYGYDFVYVEAETSAREVLRGYVPLAFLTDAGPQGGDSKTFEIVKLKEDVVFGGPNGQITLAAGTEVRLYTAEDGSYIARYSDENGKVYTQVLTEEMIDRGQSDALRIALIVILSVLALVIVGGYIALLPNKKKQKKA